MLAKEETSHQLLNSYFAGCSTRDSFFEVVKICKPATVLFLSFSLCLLMNNSTSLNKKQRQVDLEINSYLTTALIISTTIKVVR